jgi:hypothetical protein
LDLILKQCRKPKELSRSPGSGNPANEKMKKKSISFFSLPLLYIVLVHAAQEERER